MQHVGATPLLQLSIGLTLAMLMTAAPGAVLALERPQLLEPREGCELWLGQASGNDPTVRLHLRLCPGGAGVHGQVQWSSLQSGWNVRAVRGAWSGERLVLEDVEIVESRPNPGWRFCTIDRWSLQRDGADSLRGTYDSAACDDHAAVQLRRMPQPQRTQQDRADTPSLPPTGERSATKLPPEDPTGADTGNLPDQPPSTQAGPAPRTHPSRVDSGCGCHAAGPGPSSHGALMGLCLLVGASAWRMRRRAMVTPPRRP